MLNYMLSLDCRYLQEMEIGRMGESQLPFDSIAWNDAMIFPDCTGKFIN